MWWLVLLALTPPSAPAPVYPPDGGVRIIYWGLEVTMPPADVTRSVFELRREDAGWACPLGGICPAAKTAAPFEEINPGLIGVTDGRWCFRARYENDAGTSPWSADRCFLEDRTPPPRAPYVDAGLSDGMLSIEYVGAPEPGPEASGLERFCAGAIEQTTGDLYVPYCNTGDPWWRSGAMLSSTMPLPVGPGDWRGGVVALDFADNNSGFADGGPVLTVVPQGAPPPSPYWLLLDGGRGADDLWVNDTYLSRMRFPGTPTMRYSVLQVRNEGDAWHTLSPIDRQDGTTSIYVRQDVVRKQVRYAVVDRDGGVSPYSAVLNVRYDSIPPPDITGCKAKTVVGTQRIAVEFDGGVDGLSPTLWTVFIADAGLRLEGPGAQVVVPEGAWMVEVTALDEAGNVTGPVSCGGALVDVTGPTCAAPLAVLGVAGQVQLTIQCADGLSGVAAREVFRGATPLGDVMVDSPGLGEHVYTVRARDGLGNVGPVSPPSAPVRIAGDFDAGVSTDGGVVERPRDLGIGCGCAASAEAPLLLLVLCSWASTFRRRSTRRATRDGRPSSS